MNEDLSAIQRIKQEIDELLLQLSLGKTEATEFIEEQKEKFRAVVDDTKGRLTENAAVDEENTVSLRQRLDELRLQLELGKMEGREAYEEQRGKIREAISDVQKELDPMKDDAGTLVGEISEAFRAGAESFKDKLDAFVLEAGLGSIIAEDTAKQTKTEVAESLRESAEQLRAAGVEARDALEGIRENLSEIFRRS